MRQWIGISRYIENGLVIQHYQVLIFTGAPFHSQDMVTLMLQEKSSHKKINDYVLCGFSFFFFCKCMRKQNHKSYSKKSPKFPLLFPVCAE